MKITAVIMCSGLSRRMGDNKLLMLFRGRRLFEYAVDAVREVGFWKTVVVTAYEEIAQYCRDMTVVFNPDNEEGIASSVRLGVLNSGDSGGIMFFTADQPFIGVREINRLTEAFGDGEKIIVPYLGGQPKNPVIFPSRYKNELAGLTGDFGGKSVYKNHPEDVRKVIFENGLPFADIDTAEDMERLL